MCASVPLDNTNLTVLLNLFLSFFCFYWFNSSVIQIGNCISFVLFFRWWFFRMNPRFSSGLKIRIISKAIFQIIKSLGGIFNCLLIFKLLPTYFTDILYDCVAKNRYHWFGKNEQCLVPTKEIQSKFLN